MPNRYTVEDGCRYGWGSLTGDIREERKSYFAKYLVGDTVLDVGCGGGGYVEYVSRFNYQVVGLERNEQFLQVARSGSPKGTYVQGDAEALPFRDRAFDSTYCFDLLEHVNDVIAIRELTRVTKDRVIVAVPKEDDLLFEFGLTFGHYIDGTHLRYYTEQSLGELIASAPGNHSFTIFSDIEAPIKGFVPEVLDRNGAYGFEVEFMPSIILRCAKYALSDVRRLQRPNMKTCLDKARRATFLKMINSATFNPIHSNLVAVIELNA